MGLFNKRKEIMAEKKINNDMKFIIADGNEFDEFDELQDIILCKGDEELSENELEHVIGGCPPEQIKTQKRLFISQYRQRYLNSEDWTYINNIAQNEAHRKMLADEISRQRYNEYIESLDDVSRNKYYEYIQTIKEQKNNHKSR